MIIKNYALGIGGKLHITENVTEVVIHTTQYRGKSTGPGDDSSGYNSPNTWIYQDDVADEQHVAFIDFRKDGIRCRLYVTNFAYVCTDEGKTIEKVTVQQ